MKHYNRLNELLLEFTAMSQKESVPNFEKADYLELVDYCILKQNLEHGLKVVDSAIQLFPLSPEFAVKKIEILLYLNRPDQALTVLETIEHLTALSHQAQMLKAQALKATGKDQDALDLLGKLQEAQKDDFNIYKLQASILENMQQFEKLYQVIKNQILTAPNDQLDLLLEKHMLFTDITSNHQDAIGFYSNVIDIHPFCSTAWKNLGLSFSFLEDYQEAIDAFEFAIAINPINKAAYLGCTECLEKTDNYGLAIRYYNEYLDASRISDAEIFMHLGHCFHQENDIDTAQYFLQEALKIDNELADAHYLLALLFMEPNPNKAIFHLGNAIDLDSFNEDYVLALAQAHTILQNNDMALQYFQQAIDIAPDLIDTWTPFIHFLIKTKQHTLLLETLEEVATFFNPEQVIYLRVAALFAVKKRTEAKYWLAEALATNEEPYQIMFDMLPDLAFDPDVIAIIKNYRPF